MTTKVKLLDDTVIIPTGSVATTQGASDNTTKVATTAYVTTALANLADSAPSTLNTLNELAAALGDDANFSTTVTNSIALKAPLASPALTGTVTAASHVQIAGNLDVVGQIAAYNNPGSSWGTMGFRATDYTFKNSGGTVKAVLDSNGNVGIGTGNPAAPLHVEKAITGDTSQLTISNGAGATLRMGITGSDANENAHIKTNSGEDLEFHIGQASNSATPSAIFKSGGNVGIGTASPSFPLEVDGGTGDGIKIKAGNTSNDDSFLIANSSNATMFLVNGGGNVGIGETNPAVPLHISRDSASGENVALLLDNNNTTAGNEIGILFRSMVGSTNTDFEIFGVANAANDMDLVFESDGSNERVRFTGDGNVGIGTPGYGTYHSDTVVLGLGTGSTIRAANSGADPYITMANNAYHDASSWKYIHADFASSYEQYNGTHAWSTAASGSAGAAVPFAPRMKIISSGEVGIGVTPVAHYTGYRALDIGTAMSLFSNSGSTNVATMTNNGYLNSGASQWTYKVTDEATMYSQVHGDHRFSTAASGSAGGAITWNEKVRIQAAGGISFNGDTAAANALDDYEEGTWTPTINSGTATGNLGTYTKIGRQVTVTYYLNLTTLGGSQVAVSVGGLPFTSNNISAGSQSAGSILCRYFTGNQIVSYVHGNTTNINYYDNTSADWDQVTFGEIEPFHDADFVAHGTLTYFAA